MIKSMYKKPTGFTIIELLIVIAVMAILAAIVTIGWNGVSVQSRNTARINDGDTWMATFELYKTRFATYPDMSNGIYCLGKNFPGGICHDVDGGANSSSEAASVPLLAQLSRVSPKLPDAPQLPAGNQTSRSVGPYVRYDTGQLTFSIMLEGNTCPDEWPTSVFSGYGRIECVRVLTR